MENRAQIIISDFYYLRVLSSIVFFLFFKCTDESTETWLFNAVIFWLKLQWTFVTEQLLHVGSDHTGIEEPVSFVIIFMAQLESYELFFYFYDLTNDIHKSFYFWIV